MLPWSRWGRNDDGSAAVEFVTVGVILLVPLAYLVLTLGAVQENLLGAEAAARHTARVIGQAEDAASASARADAVLASVVDQYGMDAGAVEVTVSCTPTAVECPSPGATVIVTVDTRVSLPFVPAVFGLERATSIPLQASAAQKVSRLWGAG
ncbi:Flp pilus assembly protein TadG [Microbacterium ginsengiterrae]|uniref:Flp pilus assembly protein TadG n=1 Tax=Microbacterium ginsengiterrae TaxID=546115 RepID=A0A7W9FBT0_9MICO|nr:TadE family protein [Microbacterium ginsengiterrae]MBB5741763.1 Flp pilus assembly protein TadG [Microbacterium ginsengiterrae]